jgi:hypothetical protein
MRYLIDGYNLLHAVGLLSGKVGPHGLEKARLALLGRLSGRAGSEASRFTVVFDASHAPAGALVEDDYQGVHVFFTCDREADDLIEELIRQDGDPRRLTIVSDDRRLRQAAERRRCPVLRCLDFLDTLDRPRSEKAPTAELPVKPEGISPDETERWLRVFGDLADQPGARDVLGPDFDFEGDDPPR